MFATVIIKQQPEVCKNRPKLSEKCLKRCLAGSVSNCYVMSLIYLCDLKVLVEYN